jgi:ankyrin repeat protein
LTESGSDVFFVCGDGKTPAELAMAKGEDALRALFTNRTINSRDRSGSTILHYAAQTGTAANVSLLLNMGADRNSRNLAAESPADIALRWKRAEDIVTLLR